MVKHSLDHAVSDSFSNDLLSLLDALERQLLGDVCNGNLGVTDIDLLKAKLDDSVPQALDESQVLVS
jgi:hypothetical protein